MTVLDRTWNVTLTTLLVAAAAFFLLVLPAPARAQEPTQTYTVVRQVLRASPSGEVAIEEISQVTSGFVVNGNLWGPSSLPVNVRYNREGEPAGVTGVAGVIQESVGAWNEVTPATFSFTYGGETSAQPGSCDTEIHLDGINTVKFAPIAGDVLGLTCTVFLGSTAGAELVEFDMVLSNTANRWSTAAETAFDRFDLPSTILHELGHGAGLGHSTNLEAAMNPILSMGSQRRSLSADDIAGLKVAYPSSVPASAIVLPEAISAATSNIVRGSFTLSVAFVAFD